MVCRVRGGGICFGTNSNRFRHSPKPNDLLTNWVIGEIVLYSVSEFCVWKKYRRYEGMPPIIQILTNFLSGKHCAILLKNRPTENTQCEHYIFILFKALRLAVILYDATQARSVWPYCPGCLFLCVTHPDQVALTLLPWLAVFLCDPSQPDR